MALEIPAFPIESANSPEAQEAFRSLGTDTPMMALTGIDVTPFVPFLSMLDAFKPYGTFNYRSDSPAATVYYELGSSALSVLAGEAVVPLRTKYVGRYSAGNKHEFTPGREDLDYLRLIRKESDENNPNTDFGGHLDFDYPNKAGVVYAFHLFISGREAGVGSARARIAGNRRQALYEHDGLATHSRHSKSGDAHIFVRSAGDSKDIVGPPWRRRPAVSASYHSFQSIDGPRIFTASQFGKSSDWK